MLRLREILKSARYLPIEKKEFAGFRAKNPGVSRIVPILDLLWKEHEGWGGFDKMEICRQMCERISQDPRAFLGEGTIQRFETLFKTIQSRLRPLESTATAEEAALASAPMEVESEPASSPIKRRKS